MKPMEIFYYEIPAPSLDKSKKFYEAVFGYKAGGGSLGGHVESTTPPCGLSPGRMDMSQTVVYLATFDLKESLQDVQKYGGSVLEEREFPGVGTAAYLLDPNGVHIALIEPSAETLEHAKKPKMGKSHGDLFFCSIPAKDDAKSRAFYENLAGWEFGSIGSQGGQGVENLVGVAPGLGCGREGSRVSLWFRVSDIHKACQAVAVAGGTAGPIFEAPEGIMSACVDDQGFKLGLAQPAEGY